MKARAQNAVLLLCLAPMLAGCSHNIVRAASPSVVTPPPSPPQPTPNSTVASPQPIPPPELSQPAPALSAPLGGEPQPTRPPRPQAPPPTDTESSRPGTEVAAPQISPVLTPADRDRLTRLTTDQIRTAEHNLQLAAGRRLNPLQNDLKTKAEGFLKQAHDAVAANDWVRAQNLAEKAQVLSSELLK
jgi:hypothetical protein